MEKKPYIPAEQEVIPFDKEMTATILAEGESTAECCNYDGCCIVSITTPSCPSIAIQ